MKEFQNFNEFVEKLDRTYKKDYGIVKVLHILLRDSSHFHTPF